MLKSSGRIGAALAARLSRADLHGRLRAYYPVAAGLGGGGCDRVRRLFSH